MTSQKVDKPCDGCKHINNGNCTHKNNIGIEIKYRKESEFYITPLKELKKCKNYAQA